MASNSPVKCVSFLRNSNFLCQIFFLPFLFSVFYFTFFSVLTPIVETESSANCGVELPRNCCVCSGCVISLIRATTLFSMKLKSSIAAFVFRPGVACGVMFNVPTIFHVFTQE